MYIVFFYLMLVTIWSYMLLKLFIDIVVFHQLIYIIFFGVHTKYLCYYGKNDTLSKLL